MNNTNQNINNLSQSPQFNSPIQPGFGNTNYLSPPGGGIMTPIPIPGNEQPEGAQQLGQLFDDPSGNTGGMDNNPDWYDPGQYDDFYHHWLSNPDMSYFDTAPEGGVGADLNNDGVADALDEALWNNLVEGWASGTDYGTGMGFPGSDATAPPFDQYDPQFKGELGYKPSPISSIKDKPEEVPAFDFTQIGPPRRKTPPTDPKGKFWPELGQPKPPTSADFTELTKGSLMPGDVAEYNPGLGGGSFDIPTGPDDPEQSPMPTEELPPGFNWQWVNGQWEPVETSIFAAGQKEKPISTTPGGTGVDVGAPNYLEPQVDDVPWKGILDEMGHGFDVNQDGVVDILDIQAYQNLDFNPIEGYWTEQIPSEWMNVGGFEDFDEFGLDLAQQYGYNTQVQIDNPETTSFEEMIQNYASSYEWGQFSGAPGGEWADVQNPWADNPQYAPTPPPSDASQEEIQQWIANLNPNELQFFETYWQDNYASQYNENPWAIGANPIGWQDYLGQNTDFQSEQDYAGQSFQDLFESQAPWETDFVPSEFISTQPSPAEQAGYGSQYEQGFLENLMEYISPYQSSPQQFAGGGGQGGAAARKLYYPGTSGGFAGVGSGIKGGGGMKSFMESLMG